MKGIKVIFVCFALGVIAQSCGTHGGAQRCAAYSYNTIDTSSDMEEDKINTEEFKKA